MTAISRPRWAPEDDRPTSTPGEARPPRPRVRDPWDVRPARVVGFALVYTVFIYLGRLSQQPETGLALFWPASGVGVLWALTARSRAELWLCLASVMVIASVGNAVSGMSWGPGVVLGVANVVFSLVPRLVVDPPRAGNWRRWPDRSAGGLTTVAALGWLLLAITLGAMASGAVGMAGVALAGRDPGWLAWFGWITRNGAAVAVIALPLLALPAVTGRDDGLRREPWSGLITSRRVELGLLVLTTVLLVWWVFGPGSDLPLTFIPFALVAWAGLRFPAPLAGLLGALLAVLTLVLVLTTEGGPVGTIADPGGQAFTIQAFMTLTVVLAILVALVIGERDRLATRLAVSERQARKQAADLETVTDTLPDGVIVMHRDGSAVRTNRAAQQLFLEGYGQEFDRPGDAELRRLDGTPVLPHEQPTAQALAGRTVRDLRLVSVHPVTGAERVLAFAAAPLHGPDGRPDRALVLFRDVTDEHERTAQLENFAGVVAHDLQNPITAIEGWAQVLADALEELDPEGRAGAVRALGHIQRAAGRGTQLIGDLLDYSVARTSELHPVEVDLDQLVEQLAESATSADPARGTCVEHAGLGTVTADPVLLRQLFGNLLGNAVKYTPPGRAPRIQVAATRAAGRLQVTVTDNGVGIPPVQRSRVFEPFHRAHSDDARFTGTGLGLAICARAVERHGGSLEVADNPEGPGSRFTVTLPD